ncbi:hypothetical protein [Pseudomonas sp. R62]|uniref:hypothetical protein n=1 Tax=Pseudomonas sp. R62 TaxID=1144884 RepID=UPI0005789837|nr:hypothetical protein [Pseudomonas sp. R62]
MNKDWEAQALSAWRKLLLERKSGWTPRSGCDELLKPADEYMRASMIGGDGWRELVEKATAFWAHSVEGFEDWK